jgi:hypothetical protein
MKRRERYRRLWEANTFLSSNSPTGSGKKGHPHGVAQLNLDGLAHVSRPLRGFVLNGGFRLRW